MAVKKFYFGNYKDKHEADLEQHIVLQEQQGKCEIYTCTTLGWLLKMLSEKDKEIMKLKDALEECGKRVCPICGDVVDESEMIWNDRENTYVCADCAWEG